MCTRGKMSKGQMHALKTDRHPGPAQEGTVTKVESMCKINCISMRNTLYTVSHFFLSLKVRAAIV